MRRMTDETLSVRKIGLMALEEHILRQQVSKLNYHKRIQSSFIAIPRERCSRLGFQIAGLHNAMNKCQTTMLSTIRRTKISVDCSSWRYRTNLRQ
jgi:hypothetical protein